MTLKRYERNIEREKQMAKELLHKGQKEYATCLLIINHAVHFSRALLLLKKKKMEETTMERIDKHLLKIEEMVSDIEMAQMNKNVLEKLYEGSRALQTVNRASVCC